MAYCRFSSMNWRCDVYVYEDAMGGWTTHVAGRRRLFRPIPDLPWGLMPTFGARWDSDAREMIYPSRWQALLARLFYGAAAFWRNRVHLASLDLIPMRPIGLPFDGETFSDPAPDECASRLEWLRSLGYIVPQFAIDDLRAEASETVEVASATIPSCVGGPAAVGESAAGADLLVVGQPALHAPIVVGGGAGGDWRSRSLASHEDQRAEQREQAEQGRSSEPGTSAE